jgi:hypothetical protein
MAPGYICVADIEPESGNQIRPVTPGRRLSRNLLREEGGPFGMGSVVDLGSTQHVGRAPEHEDHSFDPAHARRIRNLSPDDFWEFFEGSAQASLREIFGPELHQQQRSCVFEENTGDASLGHLGFETLRDLYINDWDKLRAIISDDVFTAHVSVTDFRFYSADYSSMDRAAVESMQARLSAGVPMFLSVGVGRPYWKQGNRHFLQLNNLHPQDDPLWTPE